MIRGYHKSVLVKVVLRYLEIKRGAYYLDATLGDGGYSLEILKQGGKILGIDVDPQAIERASKRFQEAGIERGRYILRLGNFSNLDQYSSGLIFDGILFDLGVSSLQLDTPDRGFSFRKDAPVDMRMDPALTVTAADLINGLHYGELVQVFKTYGEEKISEKLANAVVSSRPITTTLQLADVISKAKGLKYGSRHPATKIFQALRILVNDELKSLEEALPKAFEFLKPDGVLEVISFHSLEDRIVKNLFREWSNSGKGGILTKKPIVASEEERHQNIRSRSAKLRVFRRFL